MFLVFTFSHKFGAADQSKVKVQRSYESKAVILKKFIKEHNKGSLTLDPAKLKAYNEEVVCGELLCVSQCEGVTSSLEILHMDHVAEI